MSQSNKTPIWKSDFPIKQDEATHVSRREFAKFLCLISGSLAIGNGLIVAKAFLFPKEKIKTLHFICETTEIAVGEMKTFIINDNKKIPYILIRLDKNRWRAFEQKCTHLSCSVLYRHEINKIECPCHKGFFDPNTGEVLQGPPPRPLPQLAVIIKSDKVYVTEHIKNI